MSKQTKKTLANLVGMKAQHAPAAWVTAYDLPVCHCRRARPAVDMILVGDSGGMVQLGHPTTNPVTMDEMIVLAKSAIAGPLTPFSSAICRRALTNLRAGMPVLNALRFIKGSRMRRRQMRRAGAAWPARSGPWSMPAYL